jgi:hypothetical protein
MHDWYIFGAWLMHSLMIYFEVHVGKNKTQWSTRKTYKEDYMDTPPPRRFRFQNQRMTEKNRPQEEEGFIRVTPFRRSSTPMYQTIFLDLCYACNNFGHKAINCKANSRNIKGYPRRSSETHRRS